jgi:uracil-DNA glycosylase
VFAALRHTRRSQVKVVILGQDPYHGPGQAHGLAFSVPPGQAIPPSLRNIRKELARDLGLTPPAHGCLQAWAERGVLLLNTVLTVEAAQAASHAGWGWEALTDALIAAVAADAHPCVVPALGGARTAQAGLDRAGNVAQRGSGDAPHPAGQPPVALVRHAGADPLHRLRPFWAGAGLLARPGAHPRLGSGLTRIKGTPPRLTSWTMRPPLPFAFLKVVVHAPGAAVPSAA